MDSRKAMERLFGENTLTGWQKIAAYLRLSVSTAKRYKKLYSLPVRSFPSGRPYAFSFELDKYMLKLDDLISGRRKLKSTLRGNNKRRPEIENEK